MKKIFLVLLAVVLIITACHKKAVPTITDRTTDPPPPITPVINVTPDLEAGKSIFMNRCARCHGLPELNKYNAEKWENILKNMIPRARIDKVQEVHVKAYILANAAK